MRIQLNGKALETACESAFDLRSFLKREGDILIVNGFQLGEDCPLKEGDAVALIPKGMMPPEDQLEAMMTARHTPRVYEKVKTASVAIAGLGGLGSNIAVSLARTGVGRLLLVDFDFVEPSNLNRQSYDIRHLGMRKTEALAQQLKEINPFIRIETRGVRVTEESVTTLFSGYDILCEAFDNPDSKAMLVETALSRIPGIKVVGASGMAGYESSNRIQTRRRMKNLYVCGDMESEARQGMGLMAPRVQVCAGHQANMILRLILGIEDV